MKAGQLMGGIAIGALVGFGVGYILGTDAEKRKQWLTFLGDKVNQIKDRVVCGCDCEEAEDPSK